MHNFSYLDDALIDDDVNNVNALFADNNSKPVTQENETIGKLKPTTIE